MTKRKNYDPVSPAAIVVHNNSNSISDTFVRPTKQQQQQPKKKKPKTIKIETEEVVVVNDEVSGQVNEAATITTEPIVTVHKRKKKLRRVDFDAEDDFELLGTSVHDTNVNISTSVIANKNTKSKTAATAQLKIGTTTKLFEDVRPTTIRLTENGGYLHTKQSRMKISQANQGKSPWNKGKERTLTAKAKISAGVRARNDELLQQKLKLLNMTEEVWYQKKRQIKLLRERVRKAKVAAKNYIEQRELQKQQERMENDEEEQQQYNEQEVNMYCTTVSVPSENSVMHDGISTTKATSERNSRNVDGLPEIELQVGEVQESSQQPQHDDNVNDPRTSSKFRNIPLFQRDIEWTPHPFDNGERYDTLCPNNGPGGFICCQYCMELYTKYMTSAIQDVQRHTTIKIGNEVEELYNYVQDTKQQLVQTMKVTRRKPIPIRQQSLLAAKTKTTITTSNATNSAKPKGHSKQVADRTKKLQNSDKSEPVANGTKANHTITPSPTNDPSMVTAITTNIKVSPGQDHSCVPFCEEMLEPVSAFTESIPNELMDPDPHFLDDNDMIPSEVYEI